MMYHIVVQNHCAILLYNNSVITSTIQPVTNIDVHHKCTRPAYIINVQSQCTSSMHKASVHNQCAPSVYNIRYLTSMQHPCTTPLCNQMCTISKYFMHKIFSMISKQKIRNTKFTILLRTASWDQVNTTELVYVFNTYLAAVDWLDKRLLQTHVMIIVEVREEVRGTLGNNTIAERIYGEHSTYNTRCNTSTVNTVPTTPDVTHLE